MIKAVLFDWDRTLANTLPAKACIALILSIKYKVNPFKAFYNTLKLSGASTFVILRDSLKVIDISKLKKDYLALFRKLSWIVWLKDKKLFEYLHSKNIKIGIVSNDLRENIEYLVKDYDVLIGYGECEPKPSPNSINLALKKLKVRASEAIYVGDSKTDMLAAKAAGVKAVGLGFKKLKKAGAWKVIWRLSNLRKIGPEYL